MFTANWYEKGVELEIVQVCAVRIPLGDYKMFKLEITQLFTVILVRQVLQELVGAPLMQILDLITYLGSVPVSSVGTVGEAVIEYVEALLV